MDEVRKQSKVMAKAERGRALEEDIWRLQKKVSRVLVDLAHNQRMAHLMKDDVDSFEEWNQSNAKVVSAEEDIAILQAQIKDLEKIHRKDQWEILDALNVETKVKLEMDALKSSIDRLNARLQMNNQIFLPQLLDLCTKTNDSF